MPIRMHVHRKSELRRITHFMLGSKAADNRHYIATTLSGKNQIGAKFNSSRCDVTSSNRKNCLPLIVPLKAITRFTGYYFFIISTSRSRTRLYACHLLSQVLFGRNDFNSMVQSPLLPTSHHGKFPPSSIRRLPKPISRLSQSRSHHASTTRHHSV